MERLSGRGALVSGGGQGLGRAISKRLAAEGAVVTVADINVEKGNECVAQIEASGGNAQFVHANVAKDDAIRTAVESAAEWSGGLAVLVNTAQYFAPAKAFEVVSMKDWELSESTGPRASFRFMQLAFPYLRRQRSRFGDQLHVGIPARRDSLHQPAVLGGQGCDPRHHASRGERVFGRVRTCASMRCARSRLTEVQQQMIGTELDNYTRTVELCPMGRGADFDAEIAPVVAFLASDDSAFVTGTVMHADGGLTRTLRDRLLQRAGRVRAVIDQRSVISTLSVAAHRRGELPFASTDAVTREALGDLLQHHRGLTTRQPLTEDTWRPHPKNTVCWRARSTMKSSGSSY